MKIWIKKKHFIEAFFVIKSGSPWWFNNTCVTDVCMLIISWVIDFRCMILQLVWIKTKFDVLYCEPIKSIHFTYIRTEQCQKLNVFFRFKSFACPISVLFVCLKASGFYTHHMTVVGPGQFIGMGTTFYFKRLFYIATNKSFMY